jgi:hypothetical protein
VTLIGERISQLGPAGTLTGAEKIPIVQAGVTYRSTVGAVIALAAVTLAPIANPTFTGTVTGTFNMPSGSALSYATTPILALPGGLAANNIRLGQNALSDPGFTGTDTLALATDALQYVTGATSFNTAGGSQSQKNNIDGERNASWGFHSLLLNQHGDNNWAGGVGAGRSFLGSEGTFTGQVSNYYNQTGLFPATYGSQSATNCTGDYVNAFGAYAAYGVSPGGSTASRVAVVGTYTAYTISSAVATAALGVESFRSLTTGSYNSGLGDGAGYTETPANAVTTASFCTYVGAQSGPGSVTPRDYAGGFGWRSHTGGVGALAFGAFTSAGHNYSVAIGTADLGAGPVGATTTADNQIRLGTPAHTTSIPGALAVTGAVSTGVLTIPAGSAGAPGLGLAGSPTTGLYAVGTDRLGIAVAGTLVADFQSTNIALRQNIQFTDGVQVALGSASGTIWGSANTQKQGWWGAAAVVQPSGMPAAAGNLATAVDLVNYIRDNVLLATGLATV